MMAVAHHDAHDLRLPATHEAATQRSVDSAVQLFVSETELATTSLARRQGYTPFDPNKLQLAYTPWERPEADCNPGEVSWGKYCEMTWLKPTHARAKKVDPMWIGVGQSSSYHNLCAPAGTMEMTLTRKVRRKCPVSYMCTPHGIDTKVHTGDLRSYGSHGGWRPGHQEPRPAIDCTRSPRPANRRAFTSVRKPPGPPAPPRGPGFWRTKGFPGRPRLSGSASFGNRISVHGGNFKWKGGLQKAESSESEEIEADPAFEHVTLAAFVLDPGFDEVTSATPAEEGIVSFEISKNGAPLCTSTSADGNDGAIGGGLCAPATDFSYSPKDVVEFSIVGAPAFTPSEQAFILWDILADADPGKGP